MNDKFYLALSDDLELESNVTTLVAFSLDFTECVRLSVPAVESFALTHYHSQLVLVGGEDPKIKEPTNQLWVSADGTDWKTSLPPMREKRTIASAINTGSPECLVVAGGGADKTTLKWLHSVEVFVNGEWFTVQPLPKTRVECLRSFIHNGTLIVLNRWNEDAWYCCRVESLLASCVRPQGDEKDPPPSSDLWEKFHFHVNSFFAAVSFGRQLAGVDPGGVKVFSPTTRAWFRAGELPLENHFAITGMLLPSGEVVVISEEAGEMNLRSGRNDFVVHKVSMKCK